MRCIGGDTTVPEPLAEFRTVPMKVLCLGYGRTGTRSIRDALLILGFRNAYHTVDTVRNPYECKLWLDALRAKHDGVGSRPGRKEFDRILGHCQAVADMPAAYFAKELIEAYPDAKVILTVRDVDAWYRSVQATLFAADTSFISAVLGFTARILLMPDRWKYTMFQEINQVLYDGDFERNGRRSFQKHYDLVRSLVPPDRLLEYRTGDGWGPLCAFLDVPVPADEVPFINQRSSFKENIRRRDLTRIRDQLKRLLDVLAYACLGMFVVQTAMARL